MTDRAPKDIPVLLRGPLVRAFLAGEKTVTRRTDLNKWRKAKPGDRIWFKETWARVPVTAFRMSAGVEQITDPNDPDMCSIYRAGWERSVSWKWRPSIFMPKWAARCWAVIEDIREERLQDITGSQIRAEGAVLRGHDDWVLGYCPVSVFDEKLYPDLISLWVAGWDSINGSKPGLAWADNPTVARIQFRRIGVPA